MDLSDKNPFSLYAFLGYVFPGAFTLYIGGKVLETISVGGKIPLDSFQLQFAEASSIGEGIYYVCTITLLLIASFIVGHIVSYISSITIEKITIWYYEYPSSFLLKEKTVRFHNHLWDDAFPFFDTTPVEKRENTLSIGHVVSVILKIACGIIVSPIIILCNFFVKIKSESQGVPLVSKCYSFVFRIGMLIVLLPWTMCTFVIGWICNMDNYMARPLDPVLVKTIRKRIIILEQRIGVVHNKSEKYDFLRIIQHFEYKKGRVGGTKMDNYVALYGFLRCVSLLFIILFWSCAYLYMFTGFTTKLGEWWLILIGCSLMSYVCYMGFMKFYRRYTVENFMSLVVDEELCEEKCCHPQAHPDDAQSSTSRQPTSNVSSFSLISIHSS